MDPSQPTIFVQIASYRDSECKFTIDDLFAKASNPERVFVGLNWQFAAEDGDVPFFDQPYRERIRLLEVPAAQSRGACWARHLTQSLYAGEAFSFQTDAHMRFAPSWDSTLVDMHERLREQGFAKPVLTHYGVLLDSRERSRRRTATRLCESGWATSRRAVHLNRCHWHA